MYQKVYTRCCIAWRALWMYATARGRHVSLASATADTADPPANCAGTLSHSQAPGHTAQSCHHLCLRMCIASQQALSRTGPSGVHGTDATLNLQTAARACMRTCMRSPGIRARWIAGANAHLCAWFSTAQAGPRVAAPRRPARLLLCASGLRTSC
jgi:hypothetical protein